MDVVWMTKQDLTTSMLLQDEPNNSTQDNAAIYESKTGAKNGKSE